DPESATASILKHVGGFGGNSGFEMMLRWPDSPGIANVWVQTSNPIGPGPVTGYRGIRLDRNAGHWAGLRPSAMASALLTGDADEQVQPWFAVGQLASRGHEGLSVSPEEGVDGTTAWTQ
ncbi:hypothetical protein G6O46_24880, partial [Salmonella enterica subsp. enterica serovar Enteritidis]|uniref:hypothetical protein n=1 Tax=Salmonella enterica TaxID=28901 RepID=UPI0018C8A5A3